MNVFLLLSLLEIKILACEQKIQWKVDDGAFFDRIMLLFYVGRR